MGTLVGWLFLETKTCWTSGLGRFFSPSKSRFGADSENECEEKETDYKERDWQMRERERKKRQKERGAAGGLADVLASSGEVHGVLGIIVDLNRLGQCLGVPAVTLARHVAAFSAARQRKAGFTSTVRNDITSQKGGK